MSNRIKISPARRLTIASKQRFRCANFIDPTRVPDYACPMSQFGGSFDESCFDIDHKVEHSIGGSDDDINLQALCVCCHRVKTRRFTMSNPRQTVTDDEEEENEEDNSIENLNQKRSPDRMRQCLTDGQVVYSKYGNDIYSATYCYETNTLDVGDVKYNSPSAFRKWVVKGGDNYSGKGWQKCYVVDKDGNEIILERL